MPASVPAAADVQRAVAEVYRRPEYQEARRTWRDWLWERIGRALMWVGERIGEFAALRHSHPAVFWAVVGWMALTVVAIIAHLIWTAVKASRNGDRDAAVDRASRSKPRGAAEWEAEAARLAAEGRLREAAVALYQALVLRLDARGVVRFDPSKTPGDYRREARKHADASRTLAGFLRLFEPVAFGGRALDADGWERMRTAAAVGGAGA